MHYLCKNLDADAKEEHVPSVGKGRIFTLIKALPDILVHKAPCVAIDYNGLNFPYYQEGGGIYIANMYASNKMREQFEMWEPMVELLPRDGKKGFGWGLVYDGE
jgi:hypothetical protein